jgi:hypothetical protein
MASAWTSLDPLLWRQVTREENGQPETSRVFQKALPDHGRKLSPFLVVKITC